MLFEIATLKKIISYQGKKLYEIEEKNQEIENLKKRIQLKVNKISEEKMLNE